MRKDLPRCDAEKCLQAERWKYLMNLIHGNSTIQTGCICLVLASFEYVGARSVSGTELPQQAMAAGL